MGNLTFCTPDIVAEKQPFASAGKVLLTEMLDTILDHFRDGRDVKILLPVYGQRSIAVDGLVHTASQDSLAIALPFERDFSNLINPKDVCQVLFSLQGRDYRLLTRIQSIVGPSELLVKPRPPAIALQEREFFRIDTRLKFNYYCLGSDNPGQPHFQQTKVNLSASGIRFPVPDNLEAGDLVALVLCLDGKISETVECLAQVIRFCKLPNGDSAIALRFAEIESPERDKIVAFCMAKEREILRTKVRTRDLF